MRFLVLISFIFAFNHIILAQEDSSRKHLGMETALIAGYTGFNQFVGPVGQIGGHQLYLGPKVNLNTFYLPGHSHLGFNTGYRYFYLTSTKFSSFISLDYQLSFYKLYDPYGHFPKNTKNNIQELVLSLGSQLKLLSGLYTSLSFGFGAYREKFNTIEDNEATDDFYGLTINTRLSLRYKLFNK